MTTEDQGHLPANSPDGSGGQFTGVANSDPEAALPSEVKGSFLFPPNNYGPNGVASYIEFWENAPISDRVLSNVISTYAQNRETWIGEGLDRWAKVRDNDPAHLKWVRDKKTTEFEVLKGHEVDRSAELERLRAERPIQAIHSSTVRSIAIAAQMYGQSSSFSKDEQTVIDNHMMQMERGGEPERVADLYRKYHLSEIVNVAFVDQDVAVQHELAELRRHIGAFSTI